MQFYQSCNSTINIWEFCSSKSFNFLNFLILLQKGLGRWWDDFMFKKYNFGEFEILWQKVDFCYKVARFEVVEFTILQQKLNSCNVKLKTCGFGRFAKTFRETCFLLDKSWNSVINMPPLISGLPPTGVWHHHQYTIF